MEIWEQIQPHLVTILGSLATVLAIVLKGPKMSASEKLQRAKEKAHANSTKKEKALHKAYEKEAALEEELKNGKQ